MTFQLVLDEVNTALNLSPVWAAQHWSISSIFDRDLVAILRLLVALVRRFAPSVRLPRGVQMTVLIVRKINGVLQHRRQTQPITDTDEYQGI